MAITFPAGPHADGDIFTNTTTGVKYIYNAADDVWKTHVWPTNTDYLQLSGGTLTGNLSLGTNDLTAQDINSTTLTTTGGVTVGNGLTVSDGNIVMANGHGIDFSATTPDGSGTVGSELLDDYEEGNWTPTITSGGWSGFQTIYNAKYTKIGRQVTVYLFGNNLQGTGNSSALKVGGLPFTNAVESYAVGSVDFAESIDAGVYCRVAANNTAVEFFRASGSVSASRVAIVGNRIGSGYIIFSATYTAA